MDKYINAGAAISSCHKYRYVLWREWRGSGSDENWKWYKDDDGSPLTDGAGEPWGDPKSCVFIMLNPSTADEHADDPTIRKCVKFAKAWKFDRMEVVNLFAYRATDPKELLSLQSSDDPVGWENQKYIQRTIEDAGKIVCAWGANGSHLDQAETVLGWIDEANINGLPLEALRVSEKTQQPWHPLYIPDSTAPMKFAA